MQKCVKVQKKNVFTHCTHGALNIMIYEAELGLSVA